MKFGCLHITPRSLSEALMVEEDHALCSDRACLRRDATDRDEQEVFPSCRGLLKRPEHRSPSERKPIDPEWPVDLEAPCKSFPISNLTRRFAADARTSHG